VFRHASIIELAQPPEISEDNHAIFISEPTLGHLPELVASLAGD
jgi:hypothetical protein